MWMFAVTLRQTFVVFLLICYSTLSFAATPGQRVGYSIAADLGLWTATYAMDRYWVNAQGNRSFPSNSFDREARSWFHSGDDTAEYNKYERRWAHASDYGVQGLIALSVISPLAAPAAEREKIVHVSRAFALNNFICVALKQSFARARPKAERYEEVNTGGEMAKSFPSSHASNAFVAATAFSMLDESAPLAAKVVSFVLASGVGLARIAADKHNFTDVVIGALIGSTIAWSVIGAADSAKSSENDQLSIDTTVGNNGVSIPLFVWTRTF